MPHGQSAPGRSSTAPATSARLGAAPGEVAAQIHDNVLDVIGDTPLVRLSRVARGLRATVAGKLEMLNPGGSVKDRIGFRMIDEAEQRGWLRSGGTIVEPTSGNTGVGLAMAAAIRGYRCVFVMPDKVSAEKVALLRAYGAEVVTTPTAVPRESPQSYYSVADRLTREIPNAFQPNQYFNPMNPRSHYLTTGPEIWRQTAGRVTHLVAGVGTGGTISGIGKYLKEQNPAVRVVGADPAGSIYTDPENVRPYKVEGIGEDFWPGTFDRGIVDEFIQVSDHDSLLTARRVTREEGILIGGSGGSAVWAALELARREDRPETLVVVILPDSGRGYLSKVYNDDWMRENGFLTRFGRVTRVGALVEHQREPSEMPPVVGVAVDDTAETAIELLRRFRISQMPVLRSGASAGRFDIHDVVGSLQERTLLDQVFRAPDAVHQPVSTVMDPPFALVNVKEEVERVFPLLSAGSPAVLVEDVGKVVGIVTRADLLEFVARWNGEG